MTRLPAVHSSAQHLASGSGSANADIGTSSGAGSSGAGGGFGTSVGMSAEMVEFVNGLEETEKTREWFRTRHCANEDRAH